ncbi:MULTISPECIES: hypothetical protein [unclassified Paenibacillus]|uniref:Tumour necrosis factor receptor superfamily member 19 n=1 Tax=Paenibacillus provencensis TaxID=441151 RepID=A0ABW3PXM1_9BACL|nr:MULTISPECIES: hypothetical protein [unclassified Paenibacillus]MCM3130630.1 hypothetical protein [Paenibacillus sp. MER 78]SDX74076.1 hypothetical protein SAMN05518848_11339 [Paenibacillus sp. PDC88]SFS89606.1 hypothetical protein SAMN04488601_106159 [Paenibacillus sp. 453mf]
MDEFDVILSRIILVISIVILFSILILLVFGRKPSKPQIVNIDTDKMKMVSKEETEEH